MSLTTTSNSPGRDRKNSPAVVRAWCTRRSDTSPWSRAPGPRRKDLAGWGRRGVPPPVGHQPLVEVPGVDRPHLKTAIPQYARPAAGRGAEVDRGAAPRQVDVVHGEELLEFELGPRQLV